MRAALAPTHLWVAHIIKEVVLAAGDARHLVHRCLHNLRHGLQKEVCVGMSVGGGDIERRRAEAQVRKGPRLQAACLQLLPA